MKLFFALIAALLTTPASAQVKQSGYVTPGHAVYWVANGIVGDAGTAANGNLTSIGVTASGPGICQNSNSPASGGYNQLCFAPTNTGGGFTWYNYNGATGVPSININGTVYPFPFQSSGGCIGPSSTTIGDAVYWGNTAGTLCSDSADIKFNGTNVTINSSVGSANPNSVPEQVSPFEQTIAVGGAYADSGTGNIFQISSYVSNTGTRPTVALFGQGIATGTSSEAWGINAATYTSGSDSLAQNELDFGALNSGLSSSVTGLALNVSGTSSGSIVTGLQFASLASGATMGIAINFDYATYQPITGSLLATTGAIDSSYGINFSSADFGTDAILTPGFAVDPVGQMTGTVGSSYYSLSIGTSFEQGNNLVAVLNFNGENSSAATKSFAQITGDVTSATASSESGVLRIATYQSGTLANRLLVGNGVYSTANSDEGANSANFSSYYLAGTEETFPGSAIIVGTTDTQTLTNKTIASPTFTGTFNINGISGASSASKYVCVDSSGNMLTQSGAC